jgi:hypothetical protein
MSQEQDDFEKHIGEYCLRLHLPESFLFELLSSNDDWTFIIKTAFVLEGAVKHALATRLGISDHVERLSNFELEHCIKLSVDLEIFDGETGKFIRFVTQKLRNKLIHDLSNHSFSFEEYLSDPNRLTSFLDTTAQYTKETWEIGGKKVSGRDVVRENPRLGIYYGILNVFGICGLDAEFKKLKEKLNDIAALGRLFGTSNGDPLGKGLLYPPSESQ